MPGLTRDTAQKTVDAIAAAVKRGYPLPHDYKPGPKKKSAHTVAARTLGISLPSFRNRLRSIAKQFPELLASPDLTPSPPAGAAAFEVAGELGMTREDATALIDKLAERHAKRAEQAKRLELIPVKIATPGPIAIVFMGDPHVDDPGCAWGDLREHCELIADTEGAFAVAVGDYRNNWIGRLTELYADHNVTREETLGLIEWLFAKIGPKLIAANAGNHDRWHTLGGDPVKLIHAMHSRGLYGADAYRLELRMPSGASARVHVRHDFPGRSQFNAAHGLVRETLWNYRDHVLACGDRHHSGYSPVWHNDPERLCHCLRLGTYKDFDPYASAKGYKFENWARSMVAIIDPRYANDPVRFISVRFSVAEGIAELKQRRAEWKRDAKKAA